MGDETWRKQTSRWHRHLDRYRRQPTATNRLGRIRARPAPDADHLGYELFAPPGAGHRSKDYRITDAIADPSGNEEFHAKKLLQHRPARRDANGAGNAMRIARKIAVRFEKNATSHSARSNNAKKPQPIASLISGAVCVAFPAPRLVWRESARRSVAAAQRLLAATASLVAAWAAMSRLSLGVFVEQ